MARLRRRDILVALFYSTVSKNSELHVFLSGYNPTERSDVGGGASSLPSFTSGRPHIAATAPCFPLINRWQVQVFKGTTLDE